MMVEFDTDGRIATIFHRKDASSIKKIDLKEMRRKEGEKAEELSF